MDTKQHGDGRPKVSNPNDTARQFSVHARVSREREIYYAAIQACGKDCKRFCIEHQAEPEKE